MASRRATMNGAVRASVPTGVRSNRAPTLTPSSNKKHWLSGRYSTQGKKGVKDGGRS